MGGIIINIFTLGISQITNASCKRKRQLYLLSRKNKTFIQSSDDFKDFFTLGNIIHDCIQMILKNKMSSVNYYCFREKKDITEAISITVDEYLQGTYLLLKYQRDLAIITDDFYNNVKDDIINQKHAICNYIKFNIFLEKGKYKSKAIDEEFDVSYEIIDGILINGKIDLLGYNKDNSNFEIIEIKSGKISQSKLRNWRKQLKIYANIFAKEKESKPKIYLWKTNVDESEITDEDWDKNERYGEELEKLKKYIKDNMNISKIAQLENKVPEFINPNPCDNCDYKNKSKKIIKILVPTRLDQFSDIIQKKTIETSADMDDLMIEKINKSIYVVFIP